MPAFFETALLLIEGRKMGQIKGRDVGQAVEANGSHLDAKVHPIALLILSFSRNSRRLRKVLGQHLGLSDINRLRLDATLVRERGERLRRATDRNPPIGLRRGERRLEASSLSSMVPETTGRVGR